MPACSGGFHLQGPVGGPGGLTARGNQLFVRNQGQQPGLSHSAEHQGRSTTPLPREIR